MGKEPNKENTKTEKGKSSGIREKVRSAGRWIKKHRTQLILGGVSIFGVYLAIKKIQENPAALEDYMAKLKENLNPQMGERTAVEDPDQPDAIAETPTCYEEPTLIENSEPRHYTTPDHPVMVNGCVVNLPEGQSASPEKIATAADNGYDLEDGQTWRRPRVKYTDKDDAA